MVISTSCKQRYTQHKIKGRIPEVATCHYTIAGSSLFFPINYKNDGAVAATTLETPNGLSIDHQFFVNNKGNITRSLREKSQKDRY